MPKNLIFDMGGVLMQHNMPGCIAALTDLMGEYEMQHTLGLCPNGEGTADSLMERFECGRVSEQDFIRTLLDVSALGTSAQQIAQAWDRMHGGIPQVRLERIRRWKDLGHHILLLSNSNPLHQRDIEQHYDMSVFDHCFYSHLVGAHKPERAIYQAVQDYLRARGWQDLETIFVDDIAINREVGESFGWRTFPSLDSLSENVIFV